MFCQKCGAQIPPGGAFCSACGTAAAPPTPFYAPPAGYVWHPFGGRTIIKRGYAKVSTVVFTWFGVAFGLLFFTIFLSVYLSKAMYAEFMRFFGRYGYDSGSDYLQMKPFLAVFAGLMLIFVVIGIIKGITTTKSFVYVCEDCVYGVAVKAFYFATKPFEVRYEQITGVGTGRWASGNIKIECGSDTYGCNIQNPEEMIEIINHKRKQVCNQE